MFGTLFGWSGLKGHWQSTVGGVVALLVATGYFTTEQGQAVNSALPQVINLVTTLVTVVVGLLSLFYKGKPAAPADQGKQ